jgi:hypothetical protein
VDVFAAALLAAAPHVTVEHAFGQALDGRLDASRLFELGRALANSQGIEPLRWSTRLIRLAVIWDGLRRDLVAPSDAKLREYQELLDYLREYRSFVLEGGRPNRVEDWPSLDEFSELFE